MSCMTGLSSHAFKKSIKTTQGQNLRREYIIIGTGSDKWNRNKTIKKMMSTGKVNDGREENISIS